MMPYSPHKRRRWAMSGRIQKTLNMTNFDSGDIALVRFPFTDLTTTKKRPAVIISGRDYSNRYGDIVFVPLTSQSQSDSTFKLSDWQAAGLLRPTWIKPIIATISGQLVVKIIETISSRDGEVVKAAIREAV